MPLFSIDHSMPQPALHVPALPNWATLVSASLHTEHKILFLSLCFLIDSPQAQMPVSPSYPITPTLMLPPPWKPLNCSWGQFPLLYPMPGILLCQRPPSVLPWHIHLPGKSATTGPSWVPPPDNRSNKENWQKSYLGKGNRLNFQVLFCKNRPL